MMYYSKVHIVSTSLLRPFLISMFYISIYLLSHLFMVRESMIVTGNYDVVTRNYDPCLSVKVTNKSQTCKIFRERYISTFILVKQIGSGSRFFTKGNVCVSFVFDFVNRLGRPYMYVTSNLHSIHAYECTFKAAAI